VQNFSPAEQAARDAIQAEASRIYGSTKDTITNAPYPGAKPVPFSPETLQAQEMMKGYATGAGQNLANQAGGYSSFLMGPAQYAEANPYLQSAINAAIRPVTQGYMDSGGVMQSIRHGATGAGQVGGSRQGVAEGIAAGRYADTVGDISTKMSMENYLNAQRAGAQSLALAPQTYGLGNQPALGLSAVGGQNEWLSQAQEDYDAASKSWGLNAPWQAINNYANIVYGGSAPGTTVTQTGSMPPKPDRTNAMLGGAMSGAAAGASFGPWGALIGAGVGLIGGYASSK
jgi:hypothetical protein